MDTIDVPSGVDVFDAFRLGMSAVQRSGRPVGFTSNAHTPPIDCEVLPTDTDNTLAIMQRDIPTRVLASFPHTPDGMRLMGEHHEWRESANEKMEDLLTYPDTRDLSDEQLCCSFFNSVFRIHGQHSIETPYIRAMLERLLPLKLHTDWYMTASLTRYGVSHDYRVAGLIRSLRFRRALPVWWSDMYPLWPNSRSRR